MPQLSHYQDAIMFGLFVREGTYAVAPNWGASGCRMTDYDHNSAHAIWDDLVEGDRGFVHGGEYPHTYELVRHSVRLPYAEPRAHPNSLGGLLTLALGQRITTQDGALGAYRHALTLGGSHTALSMAAQVAQPPGLQYVYTGLKAETFALRNNGPFLHMECELLGSGVREVVSDAFASGVDDPWLRWGDCRIWVKDVTGAPLSVPSEPGQNGTNLGIGALELSTRVVRLEYIQPCHLGAENGYRPSSGTVRASLYPGRREASIFLELDAESSTAASELDWYLLQRQLALEWQCTGRLIDPSGTYRYGFTLLLPCIQFRHVAFQEQDSLDTHAYAGVVVNDTVNPGVHAWVYTSEPAYLALPVYGDCELVPLNLQACWDMDEASGNRLAHVGGPANTLTPRNNPLGVPGYATNAAHFVQASGQYLYNSTDGPFSLISAFTIIFRVRPTTVPTGTAGLITNGFSTNSGAYDFVILALTGTAAVLVSFGGGQGGVIVGSTPLTVGQWNLVKVWRPATPDQGPLRLQINAAPVETSTWTVAGAITRNRFNIGATGGSGGDAFDYFNGDIDTVAFWDRALTPPELALFPL